MFAQKSDCRGFLIIHWTNSHLLILIPLNHQEHMVTNIYLMYYWTNAILIVQGKLCYSLGPRGTEFQHAFKSI